MAYITEFLPRGYRLKNVISINDIDLRMIKFYRTIKKEGCHKYEKAKEEKNEKLDGSMKRTKYFREKTGHLMSKMSTFFKGDFERRPDVFLATTFNITNQFEINDVEEDVKKRIKRRLGKMIVKKSFRDDMKKVLKQFTKM